MSHGPENYSRRILLAVTGDTPQIVTETLYGLAIGQDIPFVPTEIHIISTAKGLNAVRTKLLDKSTGQFFRLVSDYKLPSNIIFDESTLHGIKNSDGEVLWDINDKADNQAAADQILEIVRELTSDSASALHGSIAGGRKTMGFFLGYAMSLLGRQQDRLSHVLVSEPFERCHEFYYPPPEPQDFKTRSHDTLSSDDAKVMLAEIPFLRMGEGKTLKKVKAGDSYSAAVALLQDAINPPRLELDLDALKINAHRRPVPMATTNLAFLALFALRIKLGRDFFQFNGNELAFVDQMLVVLKAMDVALVDNWAELSVKDESDSTRKTIATRFRSMCSKSKDDLETELGELASHYRVAKDPPRGSPYRLALTADQIHVRCEGLSQLLDNLGAELEPPPTLEEE